MISQLCHQTHLVDEAEQLNSLPEFALRDQVRCDQLRCTVRSSGFCRRRRRDETGQQVVGVKVGVGGVSLEQQSHRFLPESETQHQIDHPPALAVLAVALALLSKKMLALRGFYTRQN